MVSFCNRSTVFLPISGHRYRTEFRFKISTGEPDAGGRGWGRSQGKIAEAKARPPSSKPRVIQRPYSPMAYAGAAGLRAVRSHSHTISAAIHTPSSKPRGHPAPILRVCHPAQVRSAAAAHTHTTSARHLKTSPHQSFVSFQATTDNNNHGQRNPTTLEHVI